MRWDETVSTHGRMRNRKILIREPEVKRPLLRLSISRRLMLKWM
jgi:hypothetical protein